jgi:hypothetical protein
VDQPVLDRSVDGVVKTVRFVGCHIDCHDRSGRHVDDRVYDDIRLGVRGAACECGRSVHEPVTRPAPIDDDRIARPQTQPSPWRDTLLTLVDLVTRRDPPQSCNRVSGARTRDGNPQESESSRGETHPRSADSWLVFENPVDVSSRVGTSKVAIEHPDGNL